MSNLILPASYYRDHGKPKYQCRLCGQKEYTPEAQLRHVRQCYQRNEAEVRSMSLREKAPALFGTHNVDTEWMGWHRRRGYTEPN